jgi:hypothetical protein
MEHETVAAYLDRIGVSAPWRRRRSPYPQPDLRASAADVAAVAFHPQHDLLQHHAA